MFGWLKNLFKPRPAEKIDPLIELACTTSMEKGMEVVITNVSDEKTHAILNINGEQALYCKNCKGVSYRQHDIELLFCPQCSTNHRELG